MLQQRVKTCVASRYCGRNSVQTIKERRRPAKLSIHTDAHTHARAYTHTHTPTPVYLSRRLMKCDHSDRRDPLRTRLHPSYFQRKHTHMNPGLPRIRLYIWWSQFSACVCVDSPEVFSGLWKCSPTYDNTSVPLVPLPSFSLISVQMTFLPSQPLHSPMMNEMASFT